MAGKKNKIKKILSPTNPLPPLAAEDDTLVNDLFAQLDSKEPTVRSEAATILKDIQLNKLEDLGTEAKKDSRNRFDARKARKAAALAETFAPDDKEAEARLEEDARIEEKSIRVICDDLGLTIHDINPDGHCLFAAIADQLRILGIIPPQDAHYATARIAAAQYMSTHCDDFLPFLPSVEGEDGAGATDAGLMTPAQFERYCATIRNTATWGGEPEILALSRAFNVPIHVVQHGTPPVVIHAPGGTQQDVRGKIAARISYHRKMYGLGEHYNSLRPKASVSDTSKAMIS